MYHDDKLPKPMTDFNYPPTHLTTSKPSFGIAQISDLHLSGQIGSAPSYQRFLQVLSLAIDDKPDLLLLTGDLVNDGNSSAYDWLFEQLYATRLPFVCIAGNHDVTHEIGTGLPFAERQHIPITPDNRLCDCHSIDIRVGDCLWRVLLLNSAVNGETHGSLPHASLDWLDNELHHHPHPTLIALHHHPVPMRSAWMDAYILDNKEEFWQVLLKHPHAHTVLCGHVHQVHDIRPFIHHPVRLLTCPSTDRQFAPFCDEFTLDDAPAGYRMIQLSNTATLSSYIKNVQNRQPIFPI